MAYYNKLVVKIFDPDGKIAMVKNMLPPKGQIITEKGILHELTKIADKLENDLPQLEYRMVQLRSQPHKAEYNFVYVGLRPEVEQVSKAVATKLEEIKTQQQEKEPNNVNDSNLSGSASSTVHE